MSQDQWIAFEGTRCLIKGSPAQVAQALHDLLANAPETLPTVFDAHTSQRIEHVWQAPLNELLQQILSPAEPGQAAPAPKGRGRPKLGVVAREVTLLPRHWEWLSQQSGGASVALRKLVQAAMKASASGDQARLRVNAAYGFITVVAADAPHFEDVSRALFAGDDQTVASLTASWPPDVRAHLLDLLKPEDEDAD